MGFTIGLKIALAYLLLINVITFTCYGIDKFKAVHDRWRIPEKTLIILAFLGGGIGALLGMLIFRHKIRKLKFTILVPLAIILHIVLAAVLYTGIYYHADDSAKEVMKGNTEVTISRDDSGILFDGPGSENVIIFYPGAKVESAAYAVLLDRIASEGTDCYLLEAPLHMSVLDINGADNADVSNYSHVYVAGHSMGGAVAGMYAAEHQKELDGVIFLAAYPTKPLQAAGFRALSIVGSRDGGYDRDKWQEYEKNMPDHKEFHIIDGGNHGNFGNYGNQQGDGQAEITREKQQEETVRMITEFINN